MVERNIFDVTPETDLERKIFTSGQFYEGMDFGEPRLGHPEGKVGIHTKGVLDAIDRENWQTYRQSLRLVALLHDIGKVHTRYSEQGKLIGEPHAIISERIARKFLNDENVLGVIGKHSRYNSYYRKLNAVGKFNSEAFRAEFKALDLKLLTRFIYCDLFERDQTPARWFEQTCIREDLAASGITGKLDGLRVKVGEHGVCDLKKVQGVIGFYGTDFLLNGLTDSRFIRTFGQFVKLAGGRFLYPTVERLVNDINEEGLNEQEKNWFGKLRDFKIEIERYRSLEFWTYVKGLSDVEREVYRNSVMVAVAKSIDEISGSNRGTEYLEHENSMIRGNVNGCMVPIDLIEE